MSMYKKLEKGILILKQKEEKWKLKYQKLVEDVMRLIEENSNRINTFDFLLKDQEAKINSYLKGLEKKVSDNSSSIMSLGKKIQDNSLSLRNSMKEIKDNTREMKRFKNHVTEFVNDLVSNYDNRFGILKRDIDKTLEKNMRILEKTVSIRNEMKKEMDALSMMKSGIGVDEKALDRLREQLERRDENIFEKSRELLSQTEPRISGIEKSMQKFQNSLDNINSRLERVGDKEEREELKLQKLRDALEEKMREIENLVASWEEKTGSFEERVNSSLLDIKAKTDSIGYDEKKLEGRFKKVGDELRMDTDKKIREISGAVKRLEKTITGLSKTAKKLDKTKLEDFKKEMLKIVKLGEQLDSKIASIEGSIDTKIDSKTEELSGRINEVSNSIGSLKIPEGDFASREELRNELGKIRSDIKNRLRTFEEVVASKIMELSEQSPPETEVPEESQPKKASEEA